VQALFAGFWLKMNQPQHAEASLRWQHSFTQGTQVGFKNELLYSRFGINYGKLPARFRKVQHARTTGTVAPCGFCYPTTR